MTYEEIVSNITEAAYKLGAHHARTVAVGSRVPRPPWADERDFWIKALGGNLVVLMDKKHQQGWFGK